MRIFLHAAALAGIAASVTALTMQKPLEEPVEAEIADEDIPNVFEMMDANEDRYVSRDEYETFFRDEGIDQDMRAFAIEDVDNDNRISYDEFVGPKGDPEHDREYLRKMTTEQQRISLQDDLFTAMDGNADKFITREEMVAFFKELGQVPQDGLFEGEDKDGDGRISWDEFSGPKGEEGKGNQGGGGGGPAQQQQHQPNQQQQQAKPQRNLFVEVDTNRDSRITKRELETFFEAATGEPPNDTLFSREDADSSGWISWEEFSGPKGSGPPDYSAPEFQKVSQVVSCCLTTSCCGGYSIGVVVVAATVGCCCSCCCCSPTHCLVRTG